ncbi:MAG: hypothetical protein ABIO55_08825, partial [Ginsengibacter sp.]
MSVISAQVDTTKSPTTMNQTDSTMQAMPEASPQAMPQASPVATDSASTNSNPVSVDNNTMNNVVADPTPAED